MYIFYKTFYFTMQNITSLWFEILHVHWLPIFVSCVEIARISATFYWKMLNKFVEKEMTKLLRHLHMKKKVGRGWGYGCFLYRTPPVFLTSFAAPSTPSTSNSCNSTRSPTASPPSPASARPGSPTSPVSSPPYSHYIHEVSSSGKGMFSWKLFRWGTILWQCWGRTLGNQFNKRHESFAPCYSESLLLADFTFLLSI